MVWNNLNLENYTDKKYWFWYIFTNLLLELVRLPSWTWDRIPWEIYLVGWFGERDLNEKFRSSQARTNRLFIMVFLAFCYFFTHIVSMNFKTSQSSSVCVKSMNNVKWVWITTLNTATSNISREHVTTVFSNDGASSIFISNFL